MRSSDTHNRNSMIFDRINCMCRPHKQRSSIDNNRRQPRWSIRCLICWTHCPAEVKMGLASRNIPRRIWCSSQMAVRCPCNYTRPQSHRIRIWMEFLEFLASQSSPAHRPWQPVLLSVPFWLARLCFPSPFLHRHSIPFRPASRKWEIDLFVSVILFLCIYSYLNRVHAEEFCSDIHLFVSPKVINIQYLCFPVPNRTNSTTTATQSYTAYGLLIFLSIQKDSIDVEYGNE